MVKNNSNINTKDKKKVNSRQESGNINIYIVYYKYNKIKLLNIL